MPTNRTRRSRRWQNDLDAYCVLSLMNGPDDVLLAGQGYYTPTRGGFPKNATPQQHADAIEEMRCDWELHRDRLLHWWITGEGEPSTMKLWTFVSVNVPGTRPWAWWEFDAPEDAREGETERDYLVRLGLMLPGETERGHFEKGTGL